MGFSEFFFPTNFLGASQAHPCPLKLLLASSFCKRCHYSGPSAASMEHGPTTNSIWLLNSLHVTVVSSAPPQTAQGKESSCQTLRYMILLFLSKYTASFAAFMLFLEQGHGATSMNSKCTPVFSQQP